MTEIQNSVTLPSDVILNEDGKLHWSYTLNLWRQPVMLYTAFKAMSAAAAAFGLLVCFVRMGMDGFAAGIGFLWRYLLISAIVILLLMGLSYLILCLLYKGKYTMLFEMDEAGVLHTEASEQRKKSKKLGAAAAIVGSVAGYPGAMGLVATGRSFYSRFAEVKAVKAARKQNLIRVSGGFVRNKIYAAPEQFDFVWEYIVSHCPKGKIHE